MKTAWLMLATVLAGAGCDQITVTPLGDGGMPTTCPPQPDLQPPTPPCAAAKGLSGDNLLCTDLTEVASLSDLKGWTTNQECWSVGGKQPLQVMGLSNFKGDCNLTLPAIDLKVPRYSAYSSVTLAIRHKVTLDLGLGVDAPNQLAQVYLDVNKPNRLVSQTSGDQPFEHQWIVTIDKTVLPASLDSVYKFILQLSVTTAVQKPGWQIYSIAVNGNK